MAERTVVVTLRVSADLDRRITREARRRRRSRSVVVREALLTAFGEGPGADPAREARRQSLLVSRRRSEAEALDFIDKSADDQGWR